MQALEEDEKGYMQIETPGGLQQTAIVTEAGLYSLLFAMRPNKARGVSEEYIVERETKLKNFKRWVTHEVLPSIRKHGAYLTQDKGAYIAADNSAGDFYVEEFDDLRKAIAWFDGEEKVEEK